jgi:hypothetical protein
MDSLKLDFTTCVLHLDKILEYFYLYNIHKYTLHMQHFLLLTNFCLNIEEFMKSKFKTLDLVYHFVISLINICLYKKLFELWNAYCPPCLKFLKLQYGNKVYSHIQNILLHRTIKSLDNKKFTIKKDLIC